MPVTIDEIAEAMDRYSEDPLYYSFSREQVVEPEDAEDLPEEDLAYIPGPDEIDGYQIMVDFANTRTKKEEQDWLFNSLTGKGAFRRFRASLERLGITKEWYDFRDGQYRELARQFCDENSIPYTEHDAPVAAAKTVVTNKVNKVVFRPVQIRKENTSGIVYLCADLQAYLDKLQGKRCEPDPEKAQDQIMTWLKEGCQIYALSDHGRYAAFAVYEFKPKASSLKAIYVRPEYRHKGAGRQLLKTAEGLALEQKAGDLALDITPANKDMMGFLQACGYTTLETVRITRKPAKAGTTQIDDLTFDY